MFRQKNIALTEIVKETESVAPVNTELPESSGSKGTPLPVTKSEGELTLIRTDEQTAAVIMAIVSDRSKIPLNRLNFKSIKLLDTN